MSFGERFATDVLYRAGWFGPGRRPGEEDQR
jgi:hypothetical protein